MKEPQVKFFKITGKPTRFDDRSDYIDFFARPEDVKVMERFGEVVKHGSYPEYYRLKIMPRFDSQEVYDYMKAYEAEVNKEGNGKV